MTSTSRRLLEQVLTLPASERAEIADGLLNSLITADPELDRLWAAIAEARLSAFDAGEVQAIPAEQVFAEPEDG
jgi:putative addiction module component (TIGR02574 family)